MLQNVSKSSVYTRKLIILLWKWTDDFFPPKSTQLKSVLTAQDSSVEIRLKSL